MTTMTLAFSPGCIAWMESVPPFALYRTDLDFFDFIAVPGEHYQRMTAPGIDVCIRFDPERQDLPDGPLVGFNIWGGASCVMVANPSDVFPTTLGAYVEELRRFCEEKFGTRVIFGAYEEALTALIAEHAELAVATAGWPARE
jgi:hypothetical protein